MLQPSKKQCSKQAKKKQARQTLCFLFEYRTVTVTSMCHAYCMGVLTDAESLPNQYVTETLQLYIQTC